MSWWDERCLLDAKLPTVRALAVCDLFAVIQDNYNKASNGVIKCFIHTALTCYIVREVA